MTGPLYACSLSDADLVRGCAPEQPDEVKVGQRWMNCVTGDTYPVSRVGGGWIDLGSGSYTVILGEAMLRADYVCTDAPENVSKLGGKP